MKKSFIRHLLNAIGTGAVLTGLSKVIPITNYIGENLDAIAASLTALAGFGIQIWAYFKNGERFAK